MTPDVRAAEVAEIVAEAAKLPLRDAAYSLWRQRLRLDTLEDRPTAEEVRINRAMSPAEWWTKYRYDREHAQDRVEAARGNLEIRVELDAGEQRLPEGGDERRR